MTTRFLSAIRMAMERLFLKYRTAIASVLLALIAFGISYSVAEYVFQRAALNADEHSYLFQAYNFIDGKIARPFPPNFTAFRHKMIIVSAEAGWLSRYPFGHPLFLVPGLLIGNPYLWVALAAGLSLLLIMRAGTWLGSRTTGFVAGIILLISPFFYFYHGTLLSHSSGLLATSMMLWAYIRWRKTDDWRFAVLAGLAWGFFLNNRTYTALLIAVPFAIDALWTLYRKWSIDRLKGTACFAGASLSGLLALLIYNRLSVGDFGTMTYLFYNPTENLGFGPRIYGRVDHTLARGLGNVWENVQLLNVWLFGFWGSGLLWLGLAFIGWTKEWTRLCLLAVLMVVLGYTYFWYVGPRDAGPSYYFELLPFIAVSGALGVHRIIRRFSVWPVLAAMMIMLVFGLRLSLEKGQELQAFNEPRRAVMDALAGAPQNSLVFIDPAQHEAAFAVGNDMIFNPRGLDSDPVVAHWMPMTHRSMVRYFSDRTPFKLTRKDGQPHLVPAPAPAEPTTVNFQIGPLGMHTGANDIDPDRGIRTRVADGEHHDAGLIIFGRYSFIHPGEYAMIFELQSSEPGALRIDVAADFARSLLTEQSVGQYDEWTEVIVPFTAEEFLLAEPRVWFEGSGRVAFSSVRLQELE